MRAVVLDFYAERRRLLAKRMQRAFEADMQLFERLGLVRFERPRRGPLGPCGPESYRPGGGNGAA